MIGTWGRRLALLAGGVGVSLALAPSTAQAQYVDPGAGSIIVQVVLAVIVGVAAGLKIHWGKISAFLSRRSKSSGRQ